MDKHPSLFALSLSNEEKLFILLIIGVNDMTYFFVTEIS